VRSTLKLASALGIPVMIVGAIIIGFVVPGFYMVAFEGVKPGEPIHPEELAPTLAESGLQLALGGGLLIVAIVTRVITRRKLRAMRSSELLPNTSLERTRDS